MVVGKRRYITKKMRRVLDRKKIERLDTMSRRLTGKIAAMENLKNIQQGLIDSGKIDDLPVLIDALKWVLEGNYPSDARPTPSKENVQKKKGKKSLLKTKK